MLRLGVPFADKPLRCKCKNRAIIDSHLDHILSCSQFSAERKHRHDAIVQDIKSMCNHAGLQFTDSRLGELRTPTHNDNKAANGCIRGLGPKPLDIDVTVWNPTGVTALRRGSGATQHQTISDAEKMKTDKYEERCRQIDHKFMPMAIEIYGAASKQVESFIDEVAHRAGKNPYQFRMDLLQEHPRHQRVLQTAAEAAGYGRDLPEGHALGIAVQESFGSVVAEIAEVSMDANMRPVVHKVTCAIDCGFAVNPDTAASQIESGIIFGLTAAMYGEITIEGGRVAQNNFPDYEMVRMATSPEIDVHILESDNTLGGFGEPATPPLAAAVTNAIYILTGQRVRELPIKNHDFSRASLAQV